MNMIRQMAIIALLTLAASMIYGCAKQNSNISETGEAVEARHNHPQLQYFIAQHPLFPVIKSVKGDVNNDGREDLIVIYNIAQDTNRMLAVLDLEDGYAFTNELPAPVTNQHIQFKEIDKAPPVEIIVRGTKGPVAGMAIYRVTGEKLENLFGEGMTDCCN